MEIQSGVFTPWTWKLEEMGGSPPPCSKPFLEPRFITAWIPATIPLSGVSGGVNTGELVSCHQPQRQEDFVMAGLMGCYWLVVARDGWGPNPVWDDPPVPVPMLGPLPGAVIFRTCNHSETFR